MLAFILALAAVPAAADGPRPSVAASQGFRAGDALYFVVDYLESRPGRTLWFILPFQTGPHVRVHQVVLCRAAAGGRPEVVALLEEDRTTVLSRNHMFREQGGLVVLAYDRLWDRALKTTVKEVFAWNHAEGRLLRTPADEAGEAFGRAFAGYKSPYSANPGIIERSALGDLPSLLALPFRAP